LELLPERWRIALVRLRREPELWRFRRRFPIKRSDLAEFPFVLASHETPLRRSKTAYDEKTQCGKETNVRLVSSLLNGIVIGAGGEFSYHISVGAPLRKRGFVLGPELHGDKLELGLGGGACAVSNLLFLIALRSGMQITERHRHSYDLFPDHGRTVPFGCGATVFYNCADLRFRNPHPFPVVIALCVDDECLHGEIRGAQHSRQRFEIYESGHVFERRGERVVRENRIRRRALDEHGNVIGDEELAHNRAVLLYELEDTE
jgi:vancomycin resistance protein VanW